MCARPGVRQPVSHLHLRTFELTEATSVVARVIPGAKLAPPSKRIFGCEIHVHSIGAVTFSMASWPFGAQLEASSVGNWYVLMIPEGGGAASIEIDDLRFSVAANKRGVLVSPRQRVRFAIPAGQLVQGLVIGREALDAHFVTLSGDPPRGTLLFEPDLDLVKGGGATLSGIVRLLRDELSRLPHGSAVRPHFCDVLFTALLTIVPYVISSDISEHPKSRVAPGYVRRAEEYIVAHASDPLRLPDIVRASGASARSLQAAFREIRGMSPMAFLKARRLELVRAELLAPGLDTTVARAAAQMGFSSPGRFSVEYKLRFQESPSETLSRSRNAGENRRASKRAR